TLVDAIGDAAVGAHNTAQWSKDLDNAANKQFVKAYEKMYNREPTLYASQGYDTARLIGSALEAVHGNVADTDAFRKALDRADVKSVRGYFQFNTNHFPIENFYIRKVVDEGNGNFGNVDVGKVFNRHQDSDASKCSM